MSATPHTPHLAAPATGAGPRRSLVLAGGGMRVAYQAGTVRALAEAGLRFSHADGSSGGTMNLAMILSGQSPEEMCERWVRLNVRDFASLLPLRDYTRRLSWVALGGSEGVVDRVFPQLGIDLERIRAAAGLQGTFNVCNFTYKTNEVWEHQRIERPLLVAGISLPIFMPPVPWNGSLYVDSVWIRDANLMEAVRRGAEEIWLVWCIGNSPAYRRGAFNQYVHMIELSANGKLFDELAQIEQLNAGRGSPVRLHVIRPELPLPLDPDLFRGRIDAATLIAMGYRDCRAYLASAEPEGQPLRPEVTRMRDPGPGVAMRQRLSGSLRFGADGAAEPAELEVAARLDGLAGLAQDPGRAWPLHGMLHLPRRGVRAFTSEGGWQPGRATRRDLTFRLGDRDVRLVTGGGGRTEVRPLEGGPSLASGRLSLGPGGLFRFALGAHTFAADSIGRRIRLQLRFWAAVARGMRWPPAKATEAAADPTPAGEGTAT